MNSTSEIEEHPVNAPVGISVTVSGITTLVTLPFSLLNASGAIAVTGSVSPFTVTSGMIVNTPFASGLPPITLTVRVPLAEVSTS